MEKIVVAAWREESADPAVVAASIEAAGAAMAERGHWVTTAVEDVRGADHLIPLAGDELIFTAILTVWVDVVEQLSDVPVIDAPRVAAYLATESVVLEHQSRDWADGQPSPGVSLVTAIRRKDGLTDEQFFERWHGSHAVMTLQIHPVTRYVRNAVVRPLTPGAPTFDGFVQDSFAELDDLLDPKRMYGGAEPDVAWHRGAQRVGEDVQTFVDLTRTAVTPMIETFVASAPWETGPRRRSPIADRVAATAPVITFGPPAQPHPVTQG